MSKLKRDVVVVAVTVGTEKDVKSDILNNVDYYDVLKKYEDKKIVAFNKKYEEEMKKFDDKKIVSISLINSNESKIYKMEEYLVFYEDINDETVDSDMIEAGDLVYIKDVNTKERIYEVVEKVTIEDGETKVFLLENESSSYGFMYYADCVLVAKAKDLKTVL